MTSYCRFFPLVLAAITPSLTQAVTNPTFSDYRKFLLGGQPNAIILADVNKDGILDAVAGTAVGTQVLLGNSDGTFGAPVTIENSSTVALAVADFNNDGKLDVVSVVVTNGNQVLLSLGNGNGTFGAAKQLNVSCSECGVAAADFNGDGNMDLAVASSNELDIYAGTGRTGGFGRRPFFTYPTSSFGLPTVGVVASDLNDDGKPDLVVAQGSSLVLLNSGRNNFAATTYSATDTHFLAVDLNGDGFPDLVGSDGSTVDVRLNLGTGAFGGATTYSGACASCFHPTLAAGDFNHDGKIDIATPQAVFYGNGNGTLQAPLSFNSGGQGTLVASGDFNHDGYSDLMVGNFEIIPLSVLLGGFQPVQQPPSIPAGNNPKALVSADFNHDGKLDLAVAATGDNQVNVLLGAGNGTFHAASPLAVQGPGAVVASDVNRDGKLDLVISGDYGTWIYLGNGDGSFRYVAQYSSFVGDCTANGFMSNPAPCLVVADFNNDGIPDIAGGLWINETVNFLFGNGDGTFRTGSPSLSTIDVPQSMVAGDFDKDGKMDLAVGGLYSTISVFPGNGDGTFGSPVKVPLQTAAAGLAAADMNGDGNLDLVAVGGVNSSYISVVAWVITGNGNLTFNTPLALQTSEGPNGVVLDDFNGDGLLDIAAADMWSNDVSVLINQGNLKFSQPVIYGADLSAAELVSGDFNGTGKRDIIVANQNSHDLTILLNTTP